MNFSKAAKVVFFVYIGIVLFMSCYNFGPEVQTGNDKINHAAAYFVFAVIFYFAWKSDNLFVITGCGMAFGVLVEVIQYFLPYRSAELGDLIADLVGVVLGLMVVKFLSSRNKKRARAH